MADFQAVLTDDRQPGNGPDHVVVVCEWSDEGLGRQLTDDLGTGVPHGSDSDPEVPTAKAAAETVLAAAGWRLTSDWVRSGGDWYADAVGPVD